MSERLAIDVSRSYTSGFLGKRGDDKFPCTGNKISRVEFHKDISAVSVRSPSGLFKIPGLGRGDAYTNDTDLPDIGVHYWVEMGTKLTYSLKVWVED